MSGLFSPPTRGLSGPYFELLEETRLGFIELMRVKLGIGNQEALQAAFDAGLVKTCFQYSRSDTPETKAREWRSKAISTLYFNRGVFDKIYRQIRKLNPPMPCEASSGDVLNVIVPLLIELQNVERTILWACGNSEKALAGLKTPNITSFARKAAEVKNQPYRNVKALLSQALEQPEYKKLGNSAVAKQLTPKIQESLKQQGRPLTPTNAERKVTEWVSEIRKRQAP